MTTPLRIAISTGGGDAPGLNAVIHSAVHAACDLGWQVFGIHDGFEGLLAPSRYSDGGVMLLDREAVDSIQHLGGTILGTTNRGNPLEYTVKNADGSKSQRDRSDELIATFRERKLDALITIGGDGTLGIANVLSKKGLRLVGVPKTIDNDLEATAVTFGFHSAVTFATECIDRLHSTAQSHRRIMVVEVMGRTAGWIALHCGLAGRADAILIPEIPYDLSRVAEVISRKMEHHRSYAIVVVAEGAAPAGGEMLYADSPQGGAARLGGVGERVAEELHRLTGHDTRTVVLGHLLRGGPPVAADRMLGLMFGAAAVRALSEGRQGVMVAVNPPHIEYVSLERAVAKIKRVPVDGDVVMTARTLDVALGD
jgi:6-phosphofructokinase 1